MDKLAKRILEELALPIIKEMLEDDGSISEKNLSHVMCYIDMAKDLLECDVCFQKLGKPDPEDMKPDMPMNTPPAVPKVGTAT